MQVHSSPYGRADMLTPLVPSRISLWQCLACSVAPIPVPILVSGVPFLILLMA